LLLPRSRLELHPNVADFWIRAIFLLTFNIKKFDRSPRGDRPTSPFISPGGGCAGVVFWAEVDGGTFRR
jgi:hypothetical protein